MDAARGAVHGAPAMAKIGMGAAHMRACSCVQPARRIWGGLLTSSLHQGRVLTSKMADSSGIQTVISLLLLPVKTSRAAAGRPVQWFRGRPGSCLGSSASGSTAACKPLVGGRVWVRRCRPRALPRQAVDGLCHALSRVPCPVKGAMPCQGCHALSRVPRAPCSCVMRTHTYLPILHPTAAWGSPIESRKM